MPLTLPGKINTKCFSKTSRLYDIGKYKYEVPFLTFD